jgi:hypothetical protein
LQLVNFLSFASCLIATEPDQAAALIGAR